MVALELLGESPGEVVVLGVQPISTDWGAELTPIVAGALTPLVECVLAQLKCWEEQPAPHDGYPTRAVRKRIEIQGIVQGVGFRPFVYRIAKRLRYPRLGTQLHRMAS